jgi:S-methylmethionine-dependent homocysteine/selenocysteine methylase
MTAISDWNYVTDGGLETDLIFNHGVDLPEFAAYPLLWTDEGRALLRRYYAGYADIAAAAGAGLLIETPTYRASTDWGRVLGHDPETLVEVNRQAVAFCRGLADVWRDRVTDVKVVGLIGQRGDGYAPGRGVHPDEAADYHAPQVRAFVEAGADQVGVYTLTDPGEAIGVVRAANSYGIPVTVSFTVETDGKLPDGTTLREAMEQVDAVAPPAYFLVNCAHPQHVLPALSGDGSWLDRIKGMRSNASTASHAELDEAEELDAGDLAELVPAHRTLEELLPSLEVVGGCCGTDSSHVAALWGV